MWVRKEAETLLLGGRCPRGNAYSSHPQEVILSFVMTNKSLAVGKTERGRDGGLNSRL